MRPTAGIVALVLLHLALSSALPGDDLVGRMAREHAGDSPVPSPAAQIAPEAEVVTSEVIYARLGSAGQQIRGFLARPVGEGPFPGVIVIQEWWGLNDNIRSMAERLAGQGYLALAVDLYEGEVATDRDGAMRLMRAAMDRTERLEANLTQAYEFLIESGATRVGTIGWCFGGGWSLRAAVVLGDRLHAAVVYYGRLIEDPEELGLLRTPVLGLFGELDGGIPVESVRHFESTLDRLGKSASIHIYPGADHAFANPSGTRYNAEAATDAWKRTLAFLGEHLNG